MHPTHDTAPRTPSARHGAPARHTTPAKPPAPPAHRPAGAPAPPARRPARAPASVTATATAFFALLAVLLALVPAWPAAGAQAGPGGAVPVAAGAAVPHPDLDLHADDGCTPVCAAPVRARHDHLGERPTAPDHHAAAAAHRTGTTPDARTRTRVAPGPVLISPGRTSHDSGRAPPGSSGT
ncbi:hypothetical protein ACFUIW_14970 [Streptomyces sp. NPDC057245]|uniref:hypothetical protein n=1 Tax=Streptomyces sp. NPDC057245 TaxID=3346065 RepID=UPI00364581ED